MAADSSVDLYAELGQWLLDACERGDYKYVSRCIREGANCNIEDPDLNQTPLHLAAANGHIRIVKLLLDKKVDAVRPDILKQTPFMCACSEGRIKVVQMLLEQVPEMKSTVNDQNKYNHTALHMAAANGHVKVVKLLLELGASGTTKDKFHRTAMRSACINGHAEVIEVLLKQGMDNSPVKYDITTKNGETKTINILMDAIQRELQDVAMAIMESRQVRESLQYKTIIDGIEVTPMRLLFKKMPEVAERALVYCTDQPKPEDRGDNSDKYKIGFRYEFLDDFADTPIRHSVPVESTPLMSNISSVDMAAMTQPSWKPVERDRSNHCLQILINSKSKILVRHPVVTTMLYRKWKRFAWVFFLLALFVHLIFAVMVTTFALIILQPKSLICTQVFNNTNPYAGHCEADHLGQPYAIGVVGVVILIIAIARLLFELFRLVVLRWRYFLDFVNFMELLEFTGAILFVSVFSSKCFCPYPWQWQVGAGCVFLAWIDLLLFIRLFPVFGIYVVMFLKIVQDFAKVATLLAIFLVFSFTFPFFMLFHDPNIDPEIRTPFRNPANTFVKTLTMMTGGVNFDSLFHLDYTRGDGVQYAVISYPFIIIFIVVMTILLNNLLTGLAVGEVNEVRAEAKIRTLSLWVEFILLCEQLLSRLLKPFKKRVHCEPETDEIPDLKEFPDKYTKWFWYRALELNHFETYDTRLITPDTAKCNEKLANKMNELMAKMEKIEDQLDNLTLRHVEFIDED